MRWRLGAAAIAAVMGAAAFAITTGALAENAAPTAARDSEAQAREALAPLKKGLMGALKAALQDSPRAAVDVCQVSAPAITEAAGTPKVRVGRTSHRLRNPSNAPEPWMEPLLAEYLKAPQTPLAGKSVPLDGGRVGYVEPIYTKPLCTTCHGSAVEPALLAHIRERYPEDDAVGFEEGELRGLFWVVLEKSAEE
jgi:hypothetical protein